MFADACEKARKFTMPVIISTRSVDGRTTSGCAAFIVLNREGWFITAGHVFASFIKYNEDIKKIKEIDEINAAPHSGEHKDIKKDPSWLTNQSFWWGWDGVAMSEVYVNNEIDIAVGKLKGFKPEWVQEYPVFKDPEKMRPGTSLCRVGFPFISENITDFDEKQKSFRIRNGIIPIALFPNEGIHTRNIFSGVCKEEGFEKLFVETSSPGMKGQSGGPIFDRNGFVAALQVKTAHLSLGFAPSVINEKGEKVVENQFINVGIGVHVKTIMKILDSKGVKYNSETDDQGFRIVGSY